MVKKIILTAIDNKIHKIYIQDLVKITKRRIKTLPSIPTYEEEQI